MLASKRYMFYTDKHTFIGTCVPICMYELIMSWTSGTQGLTSGCFIDIIARNNRVSECVHQQQHTE